MCLANDDDLTRSLLIFPLILDLQNGISHAFVVEFESAADRDYYVREDPAHQGFIKSLDGIIEKAQVIDFANGVF